MNPLYDRTGGGDQSQRDLSTQGSQVLPPKTETNIEIQQRYSIRTLLQQSVSQKSC